jgi:hypothetical protein
MIVINRNGLTEAQRQKVMQLNAGSADKPIDFKAAAKEAGTFFSENPDILNDIGEILNTAS